MLTPYFLKFLLTISNGVVNCLTLEIILPALITSTPDLELDKCSSKSSNDKLEVKNVVKPSSIRYCNNGPNGSKPKNENTQGLGFQIKFMISITRTRKGNHAKPSSHTSKAQNNTLHHLDIFWRREKNKLWTHKWMKKDEENSPKGTCWASHKKNLLQLKENWSKMKEEERRTSVREREKEIWKMERKSKVNSYKLTGARWSFCQSNFPQLIFLN